MIPDREADALQPYPQPQRQQQLCSPALQSPVGNTGKRDAEDWADKFWRKKREILRTPAGLSLKKRKKGKDDDSFSSDSRSPSPTDPHDIAASPASPAVDPMPLPASGISL